MSLRKRWQSLDRETIARVPDRYGVYELGDEEGTVVDAGAGFLPDELRDAFAYGEAASVRWREATSEAHAERLLEDL